MSTEIELKTYNFQSSQSFYNRGFHQECSDSSTDDESHIRQNDILTRNGDVATVNGDVILENGTGGAHPVKSVLKKPTLSADTINNKKTVTLELVRSASDDDLAKQAAEAKRPSLSSRKSSIADIALSLALPRPSGAFDGPLFDRPKNKGRNMYIHPYGNPLNAVERALMQDFDFDNESFGKSLVKVKPTASHSVLLVWIVFFFCLVGVAGAIIFVSGRTYFFNFSLLYLRFTVIRLHLC